MIQTRVIRFSSLVAMLSATALTWPQIALAASTTSAFAVPEVGVSGEQVMASAPSHAAVAANASLRVASGDTAASAEGAPVVVQEVIYAPSNPNIVVVGKETAPASKTFHKVVWIQITRMTNAGPTYKQWQYAVPVQANGSFAVALQIPFASGRYQVEAAPPLTTAQTSLTYSFATNRESVSNLLTLTFPGADSNQQLGLLSSAWADWNTPQVEGLARQITAGLNNPLAKVRAIYDWEGHHIGYNGALLKNGGYGWSTTQETLASGVGICVDYANVGDALARALGISTQMVDGVAYNATGKVDNNEGHAWNRSWINGAWINWDPTWSRVYLVSNIKEMPGPETLYLFHPQWFNPSPKQFASTHTFLNVAYQ